jgi:hypothetical protein
MWSAWEIMSLVGAYLVMVAILAADDYWAGNA